MLSRSTAPQDRRLSSMTSNTAQPSGPSANPSPAATLEFRNVQKVYPGTPEPAIQDLSLEICAGEICVLVGPSAAARRPRCAWSTA
jgi:osmoprotectant transport system ATP-binding protein